MEYGRKHAGISHRKKSPWETAGSLHRKDPGNSTKQISRDNPLVGRRKT